jgi:hypothetical protein
MKQRWTKRTTEEEKEGQWVSEVSDSVLLWSRSEREKNRDFFFFVVQQRMNSSRVIESKTETETHIADHLLSFRERERERERVSIILRLH